MNKKTIVIFGIWGLALAALFVYGRMKKQRQQDLAKPTPGESATELVFLAPGFT